MLTDHKHVSDWSPFGSSSIVSRPEDGGEFWKDVRRWLTDPTGRWKPISADGIELFNPATIPIRRYRYRGNTIPIPWATAA